ncbi:MAG: DNA polymerase IV [Candidatus Nanoarchaeia archaeon]
MRIILHIDLDAFFAQVEQRDRKLKGKPVVVGADPKGGRGRGVVSAASYEARKFGIKAGMPISIAYKKCPNCIFLPVDMPKYVENSARIMVLFKDFADKFEQASIDECYLDVSQRCKNFEEAIELAKKIKAALWAKEALTCSIGIGPNKLIAKIAAGQQKPNGLMCVKPEDVSSFLAPLDVSELLGVGPKTKEILNRLGIYTISDLRKLNKEKLIDLFGKFGNVLYEEARGIDETPIIEFWEPKSLGRQHTFEKDTRNKRLIFTTLSELVCETIKELKAQGYKYKTITIKVRYEDFFTTSKAKTLETYHDDAATAQIIARQLLLSFLNDPRAIRLIGFSVSKLQKAKKS